MLNGIYYATTELCCLIMSTLKAELIWDISVKTINIFSVTISSYVFASTVHTEMRPNNAHFTESNSKYIMKRKKDSKSSESILQSLIHHPSTDGLVRLVGSGRQRKWCVQCLWWAARLKHTWCELPGLCNQGRALSRARSHGREMTGYKLETNHLGLKLALGLCYPSVRLSLEAPGLPLSTAERSTSGVKPNLDTWCVPAEFALCL